MAALERGEVDSAIGNLPDLAPGFYQQRLFRAPPFIHSRRTSGQRSVPQGQTTAPSSAAHADLRETGRIVQRPEDAMPGENEFLQVHRAAEAVIKGEFPGGICPLPSTPFTSGRVPSCPSSRQRFDLAGVSLLGPVLPGGPKLGLVQRLPLITSQRNPGDRWRSAPWFRADGCGNAGRMVPEVRRDHNAEETRDLRHGSVASLWLPAPVSGRLGPGPLLPSVLQILGRVDHGEPSMAVRT